MDLSQIMNIQDGFLQNKAHLLLDHKLTNSVTPHTTREKIQASFLSKIRMNENKKPGNKTVDPPPMSPGHDVRVRAQHCQEQPSGEKNKCERSHKANCTRQHPSRANSTAAAALCPCSKVRCSENSPGQTCHNTFKM